MGEDMCCLFFWVWVTSPNMIFSLSVHLPASFIFIYRRTFQSVHAPHSRYPSISHRAFRWFSFPSYCGQRSREQGWASFWGTWCRVLWVYDKAWHEGSCEVIFKCSEITRDTNIIETAPVCYGGFSFPHIPSSTVASCFLELWHLDCGKMKSKSCYDLEVPNCLKWWTIFEIFLSHIFLLFENFVFRSQAHFFCMHHLSCSLLL